MKKLSILLLLTTIAFKLSSQNEFFNNGSSISVQAGGLIYIQGEFINTDNGANIGLTANSGSITLSADWTNNSTTTALNPTTGLVQLNGGFQQIQGTQPTTFNNLTLLGTNTKQLNINTIVGGTNGVLNLTARPLDLNSNTLFVTNPLPAAVIKTSGYIISETPATPGYGIIQWDLGANTGNYEFPFGTTTASYIPVYYNISAGGVQTSTGNISVSTYPTVSSIAINNRPLPTGVNDLINNCGTEHATKMVDRFWVINANNYATTPTVTKKLTYLNTEWNTASASTNLITEPLLNTWYYSTTGWTPITSNNNVTLNEQTITTNTNYGVFTLGEYKKLDINLVNIDSVKCFGQSNGVIQFSVSQQGYDFNNYSWNSITSTDTIKTNLIAGTYTIIATDAMGCSDTINTITVDEPLLLTQTLTANDNSICRNQPVQLTSNYGGGTKPYTLNWSTGIINNNLMNSTTSITNTPANSIIYFLTVVDKNNCTTTNSVSVNVNQLPIIDFDADVKKGCQPLPVNFINLSGNNPVISTYLWAFSQGVNSPNQSPFAVFNNVGIYTISLIATSDSGCVNSITKNSFITVYEKPTANFNSVAVTEADILDPKFDFTNTSLGNYTNSLWNFGDGQTSTQTQPETHSFYDVGIYYVTLKVSTENNCYDYITKTVEVKDAPVIFIPNTFTPLNADGLNDIFTIKGTNFYDFKMIIFNRWGQKIAETNDVTQGWNGKFKGQDCEMGTYIYQISIKYLGGYQKGITKTFTGHVNLLN